MGPLTLKASPTGNTSLVQGRLAPGVSIGPFQVLSSMFDEIIPFLIIGLIVVFLLMLVARLRA